MNKYQPLANQIIELSGGKENFTKVWNCFSRLRFSVNDENLVDLEKIRLLEGVLGCQFSTGHFQVVIGHDVGEVTDCVKETLGLSDTENDGNTANRNLKIHEKIFDTLAGVFTPILVAIVSAGLLKGVLAILVLTKVLSEASDVYAILSTIADASFFFLPFLLAVSTAKKFNTNEYLAIAVAGALMHPTIMNAAQNGIESYRFFGLSIPAINYSSTVLPIILSVILLSYVYRYLNKIIPNMFRFVLTPVCTLLIIMPIVYIVLAPLGMYLGTLLTQSSLWLRDLSPFAYGLVVGAAYPVIIMTGMHYAFFPIMLSNIASNGFENIFLPIAVVGNIATAVCVLAVFFRSKDAKTKSIAMSSTISAIFGVIEPALFAIVIPFRKVLYALMIATGAASAVLQGMGVKMFTFVAPSILSIPVFINPDGSNKNIIGLLISSIIAIVLGFGLSYLAMKKEKGAL